MYDIGICWVWHVKSHVTTLRWTCLSWWTWLVLCIMCDGHTWHAQKIMADRQLKTKEDIQIVRTNAITSVKDDDLTGSWMYKSVPSSSLTWHGRRCLLGLLGGVVVISPFLTRTCLTRLRPPGTFRTLLRTDLLLPNIRNILSLSSRSGKVNHRGT